MLIAPLALAKGASAASIDGPGTGGRGPIDVRGDPGAGEPGGGTDLERLALNAGIYAVAFGLRQLGRELSGASRDVSAEVVAALRPARHARATRGPARRPIIALVILTLLGVGAATAVRLGVGGVDLRESSLPPRARTPLGSDPTLLGSRTTLDDARQRVGFEIRVPTANGLGEPDVYVATHPPGGRVSLVYPASRDLPAIGETRVGLLLTAFRGTVETNFLTKLRATGAPVTDVRIGPTQG